MMIPLIDAGLKIIEKIIPDPAARDAAKLELLKQQQEGQFKEIEVLLEGDKAQSAINEKEAENSSLFVSGWRPAVGWTCVGGLSYQLIVRPIFTWVMQNAFGWQPAPSLEIETLMTLLFGILGLGAYRTVEKTRGVARS